MPNSDLLPSLLFKIKQNQLALEAAILELSNWVEQRGSADVADNVRGALNTIDKNEEFIKLTLAVLMTPECQLSARSGLSAGKASDWCAAQTTRDSWRAPFVYPRAFRNCLALTFRASRSVFNTLFARLTAYSPARAEASARSAKIGFSLMNLVVSSTGVTSFGSPMAITI